MMYIDTQSSEHSKIFGKLNVCLKYHPLEYQDVEVAPSPQDSLYMYHVDQFINLITQLKEYIVIGIGSYSRVLMCLGMGGNSPREQLIKKKGFIVCLPG
jgi:hypothetical protein